MNCIPNDIGPSSLGIASDIAFIPVFIKNFTNREKGKKEVIGNGE